MVKVIGKRKLLCFDDLPKSEQKKVPDAGMDVCPRFVKIRGCWHDVSYAGPVHASLRLGDWERQIFISARKGLLFRLVGTEHVVCASYVL